ncbi:MAG: MarR family winged helix-turn-helix transcriptional regulator [Nocardioides sp.]
MRRGEALGQLEQEVGVLIRRVRRVIGERARAVHDGLQPSSYLILAHLADCGPARSSSIVDTFEIDKGAISRQVQHLVDLGLVEREPDPADGRATLLTITPEATRRLAEVTRQRRELFDERLGDWTEAELTDLVSALSRYNHALEPSPLGAHATVAPDAGRGR